MRKTGPVLLFLLLVVPGALRAQSGVERLYRQFQDPPHEYTIRPFWFWNGKLDAKEIEWQIDQMVAQGVYGAYVHNRTGLQTPYLSEAYFRAVGAAFRKSREVGFHFGFVDEYEWPGGEARDIWQKGLPSRVIAANPDFRMRSLGYAEKEVSGPGSVDFENLAHVQFAVAGRLTSGGTIDSGSLKVIPTSASGGNWSWQAPAGRWQVMVFYLHPTQGFDGGLVDLLNADAIRKFLDLTYEQYYKRFGEYFGKTLDSVFSDHEGDYGYRIAWTPKLFETFQRMKDYDLRKYLPLLVHEGGKRTPKVRADYLDVVSEIYYHSYFKQVADWCKAHKIKITGHLWEETLQKEAGLDGDLPRAMRGWSWPGVDSLFDRGRLPRDFKAAASVADFRGTRFACENQGLQGMNSFLDFQKMRLGTNMIGVWGVNSFTPHAFNYNRRRIEFPPDWFYHEPYWKYFRHYADYTRRISYMNAGGRHVADILVYEPMESAWAATPVFSNTFPYRITKWGEPIDTINSTYTELLDRLAQERWDYDVTDAHYLLASELKGGRIHIRNESFRVLILPPATMVRRSMLHKIREFYDQGGIVIGTRMLPTDSMEAGRDDPAVAQELRHIFGSGSSNSNAAGGKAFIASGDVSSILQLLGQNLKKDVRVIGGEKSHLFYLHRQKEGVDFYWMVNDSENPRTNTVLFSADGAAEKWDASDASKSPLYYRNTPEGTEARLHFDPWEAYYVVFRPGAGANQTIRVVKTNLERYSLEAAGPGSVIVRGRAPLTSGSKFYVELEDRDGKTFQGSFHVRRALPAIELKDSWSFRPQQRTLFAPYAVSKADAAGQGERSKWQAQDYQTEGWQKVWLSRERFTVRDWSVIGPFTNADHRGFSTAYPPEKSVDLAASYPGAEGSSVRWGQYTSPGYVVDLQKALGLPQNPNWTTAYAVSYVYAPSARRAQFRIAAYNNAKLWVNGRNLLDLHIHPFYYEFREDFALTRTAELKQGWNEVLVKVSKAVGPYQFAFLLRITDSNGANFNDLVVSPVRRRPAARAEEPGKTWYRIAVPVAAVGVKLPRFRKPVRVFYDGRRLAPDASGSVRFPSAAEGTDNVVAVETARGDVIADNPQFLLGMARITLGSWTTGGLPYYSGSASYEQDFELPREYAGKKLILDCGQVGVVAEVWVNGKPAGSRVWLPFAFDISRLVRPGSNHLKIIVTNTMENSRAIEDHADKLKKIQLNGLLGPVRIVPYLQASLRCPLSER